MGYGEILFLRKFGKISEDHNSTVFGGISWRLSQIFGMGSLGGYNGRKGILRKV